jgi:molybdate transport system substrate-binding protein
MPRTQLAQRLVEQDSAVPEEAPRAHERWPRLLVSLAALLGMLAAYACGGGESDLTVVAAISLRGPMEEIAAEFEAQHPDVDIAFNFAGSQRLRFQLEQGAKAEVFVSADERQMTLAARSQLLADRPLVFAGNRLIVALPDGNPGDVQTLEDLASPGLRVVWADETVPLGAYSREVVSALGGTFGADFQAQVEGNIVSEEESAAAVAGKVELGEADAAIIYETDVPRLEREGGTFIAIPDADQPDIGYLVAPLEGSGSGELSQAFVSFLLSDEGQRILIQHGFLGVS